MLAISNTETFVGREPQQMKENRMEEPSLLSFGTPMKEAPDVMPGSTKQRCPFSPVSPSPFQEDPSTPVNPFRSGTPISSKLALPSPSKTLRKLQTGGDAKKSPRANRPNGNGSSPLASTPDRAKAAASSGRRVPASPSVVSFSRFQIHSEVKQQPRALALKIQQTSPLQRVKCAKRMSPEPSFPQMTEDDSTIFDDCSLLVDESSLPTCEEIAVVVAQEGEAAAQLDEAAAELDIEQSPTKRQRTRECLPVIEYDAYGFRKDSSRRSLPANVAARLPGLASAEDFAERPVETPPRTAKWQSMLEQWAFWSSSFPITLRNRVLKGIPHSVRRQAWANLAGIGPLLESEEGLWEEMAALGPSGAAHQIRVDVDRTFSEHQKLESPLGEGRATLNGILNAYAHHNPVVVYCQGMSYVAGVLLLTTESAKETFYLLKWIVDNCMQTYYHPSMSGIIEDSEVFGHLVKAVMPNTAAHLKAHEISPLMYITQWFLSMFTTLRCWESSLYSFDLLFFKGTSGLFHLALAILQTCQDDIQQLSALDTLLPYLQNVPPCRSHPTALHATMASIEIEGLLAQARADYQQQAAAVAPPTTPSQRAAPAKNTLEQTTEAVSTALFGFWRTFATPIKHRIETSSWRSTPRMTPRATPMRSAIPTPSSRVPKPTTVVRVSDESEALSPTFTTPRYSPKTEASEVGSPMIQLTPRKLFF